MLYVLLGLTIAIAQEEPEESTDSEVTQEASEVVSPEDTEEAEEAEAEAAPEDDVEAEGASKAESSAVSTPEPLTTEAATEAVAAKGSPYTGLRLGACGGWSSSCAISGVRVDYALDSFAVGASTSILLFPSVYGRYYPVPVKEEQQPTVRPFVGLHGAWMSWMGEFTLNAEVGADIHVLKSKRLILQPTASIDFMGMENGKAYFQPGGMLTVLFDVERSASE